MVADERAKHHGWYFSNWDFGGGGTVRFCNELEWAIYFILNGAKMCVVYQAKTRLD